MDNLGRHGERLDDRGGHRPLNYAGTASSDSATYTNVSVADGEKSYVTIAADINSASGTPTLRLTDGDGDYVEVTLYDSSTNADSDTVLANSTGEGKVLQQQVGSMTLQGSGDGSFGSTEEVSLHGDIDADDVSDVVTFQHSYVVSFKPVLAEPLYVIVVELSVREIVDIHAESTSSRTPRTFHQVARRHE